MGDNHRGICFFKDEKTMRVHGAVEESKYAYMCISNFPTSYYNPCQKDRWNVVCVVYGRTSSKSSLLVNHGKICDFVCRLPLKPRALNAVASTVILKVLRCSSITRLFHLVSLLLE